MRVGLLIFGEICRLLQIANMRALGPDIRSHATRTARKQATSDADSDRKRSGSARDDGLPRELGSTEKWVPLFFGPSPHPFG